MPSQQAAHGARRLPQEAIDFLVQAGRADEIPAFELAYERLDEADVPENKIADSVEAMGMLPGMNTNAWKPFARDNWRAYAKEVMNLRPNEAQLEIAALEASDPTKKKTLDPEAPRFTVDQAALLDSIDKNKRTGCGAGNSVGKSDAVAVGGRYLYDKDYKVIILANTIDQVSDIIFAYIRAHHVNAVAGSGGYLYPERPLMKYDAVHVLQAIATDTKAGEQQVKGLSGRHYHQVAVIIDEAQGASAATIQTAERICTGPNDKIVLIYNPTDPGCAARKAMKARRISDNSLLYNEVQISGENHPNVVYNRTIIPGAVHREFVDAQLAFGGGTRDSAWFRCSVLGEWPDDKPDALIKEEWIIAAQARGARARPDDHRGTALGVDVAGEGGDLTNEWCMRNAKAYMPRIEKHEVLAKYRQVRRGPAWHVGRDTTVCEELIYATMNCEPDIRHVGLDDTGLGQSVRANINLNYKKHFPKYTEFRRTDPKNIHRIQIEKDAYAGLSGFTFGATPHSPADDRFKTVKHQLLWHLREKLQAGEFDLPTDSELASYGLPADSDLIEQLTRCIWGVSGEKKLVIMDKRGAEAATETMKEQAKNLPYDSPDLLHALAIACWVYFKILRPGPAPIKSTVELRALEQQRMVARLVRQNKKPLRRKGKLPWLRR